jgi:hypothetical protein
MNGATIMWKLIMFMWLAGCSADGVGDDDQPPPHPPGGQGDDDAAKDREECEIAGTAEGWAVCPLGWARHVHSGSGASEDDQDLVELEDVAEPVCNGRGFYAEPQDFEGAIGGPEITLVRNSYCSMVCYPQCSFTSVCYAENPDGQACGHACMPTGLTKDECAEFVAECLGEDAATCEG